MPRRKAWTRDRRGSTEHLTQQIAVRISAEDRAQLCELWPDRDVGTWLREQLRAELERRKAEREEPAE